MFHVPPILLFSLFPKLSVSVSLLRAFASPRLCVESVSSVFLRALSVSAVHSRRGVGPYRAAPAALSEASRMSSA